MSLHLIASIAAMVGEVDEVGEDSHLSDRGRSRLGQTLDRADRDVAQSRSVRGSGIA